MKPNRRFLCLAIEKNLNSRLFNFQFLIERISQWNNRLFMSLILSAVNIQHFLSSSFVKHLTIVRCSEIFTGSSVDEYFSSDLSPPPSLPSFGSSPYGYLNSLRFRGFSCLLGVLVLLGFVSR